MNTMKFGVAFFALLFTLTLSSRTSAQVIVPYDSLSIDSVLQYSNVDNIDGLKNARDGNSAHFIGGSEAIGMRFIAGGHSIVMQKGDCSIFI